MYLFLQIYLTINNNNKIIHIQPECKPDCVSTLVTTHRYTLPVVTYINGI